MEKLRIIGLLGKAKSGKDTAGTMLCDAHGAGAIRIAFADKLKSIAEEMFSLSYKDMNTDEGKNRETKFPCYRCPDCHSIEIKRFTMENQLLAECKLCGVIGAEKVFKSFWTPRTILQYLGTEGFRAIDPNVWVNYALDKARYHLNVVSENSGLVIITDCRFRSEIEAIWAVGGEVWRIVRPELVGKGEGLKGHASETEQDSFKDSEFQVVIMNDGSLDSLQAKVASQVARFLRVTSDYKDKASKDPAVVSDR